MICKSHMGPHLVIAKLDRTGLVKKTITAFLQAVRSVEVFVEVEDEIRIKFLASEVAFGIQIGKNLCVGGFFQADRKRRKLFFHPVVEVFGSRKNGVGVKDANTCI